MHVSLEHTVSSQHVYLLTLPFGQVECIHALHGLCKLGAPCNDRLEHVLEQSLWDSSSIHIPYLMLANLCFLAIDLWFIGSYGIV